jgi:hypothetical protein
VTRLEELERKSECKFVYTVDWKRSTAASKCSWWVQDGGSARRQAVLYFAAHPSIEKDTAIHW